MDYSKIATDAVIAKTVTNLNAHGMEAMVVPTKAAAKQAVLDLIPKGAEVMTMSSVTLHETGIAEAIDGAAEYVSVRNKLSAMNRETQSREMQILGAAPAVTVGSVHAVTEEGVVYIASNTGSQLPAYVYGSDLVIWVVGAQKIVPDANEAMKRIYDYILPKESVRLNAQYHMTAGSYVSKLLTVFREIKPGRIKVIIVKEPLGF